MVIITKLQVAPVELIVSSQLSSSCRSSQAVLFDYLDTAKMHGLDTSNVSSRDEPSGIWAFTGTAKDQQIKV